MGEKFNLLQSQRINSLADLRSEMKTPKRIGELAVKTGIDEQYLKLLRREIEGYFPKPVKLTNFDWIAAEELEKLIQHGIKDSKKLYEATTTDADTYELQTACGVDAAVLQELRKLCNLTRVQWVSANAALMILLSGYNNPAELAEADADDLDAGLKRVNVDGRFYKSSIGMRDVQRLIDGAKYVT